MGKGQPNLSVAAGRRGKDGPGLIQNTCQAGSWMSDIASENPNAQGRKALREGSQRFYLTFLINCCLCVISILRLRPFVPPFSGLDAPSIVPVICQAESHST